MQERREYPRLDYGLNVYGPDGYIGCTGNISLDGCSLVTAFKIKKKSLDISFELPGSLDEVNTQAKIVWDENNSFGIRFVMSEENKKIHSRFISSLS